MSTEHSIRPGRGRVYQLEREQWVGRPLEEVFAFFADAANLEAITPPFLHFSILTTLPIEMRVGTRIDYRLSLFGLPFRWRTRIAEWHPGRGFVDEQAQGPYALWRHTHTFEARAGATRVVDRVEYALPLGPLGDLAHALFVRRTLQAIFDYRHQAIERLVGGPPAPPAPASGREPLPA
jgi:ligand-binding SRPBCC domain-containing protein